MVNMAYKDIYRGKIQENRLNISKAKYGQNLYQVYRAKEG